MVYTKYSLQYLALVVLALVVLALGLVLVAQGLAVLALVLALAKVVLQLLGTKVLMLQVRSKHGLILKVDQAIQLHGTQLPGLVRLILIQVRTIVGLVVGMEITIFIVLL